MLKKRHTYGIQLNQTNVFDDARNELNKNMKFEKVVAIDTWPGSPANTS